MKGEDIEALREGRYTTLRTAQLELRILDKTPLIVLVHSERNHPEPDEVNHYFDW